MSDLVAPIEEGDLVMSIRRQLAKLARTDLPIVLVGEPGTGRRSLAIQIAELRQQRTGTLAHEVHASTGLGDPLFISNAATPMVIGDLHCLPAVDQVRLAAWLKDGLVILAATTTNEPEIALAPQLAAVLSYPSAAIRLPPLGARGGDAVRWAEHFLAEVNPDLRLDATAQQAIEERTWSGNLLELRVTIERAAAIAEGGVISADDVKPPGLTPGRIVPLSQAVAEFKRRYILETLERVGGNRTKAARALGVDPRTVFRVLQQEEP